MKILSSLGCSLFVLSGLIQGSSAQQSTAEKPKQFIYILHLVPRLYDDKNWKQEDKAALERHSNRSRDAARSGQLILAGSTREVSKIKFGVVIFEASDEDAARTFMETDPAVVAGIMTAELHPFKIVLQR